MVQTLENCEMKEKCYRVSQVEYYYEIVRNSAGHREERLKVGLLRLSLLPGGLSCAAAPPPGGEQPGGCSAVGTFTLGELSTPWPQTVVVKNLTFALSYVINVYRCH